MATTEQTANGVVGPEAAGSETVAQDPTLEGSAPLSAPDASMEAPTATEGAKVEPSAAQTEAPAPDPLPEPYTSLFKQAKEAPSEFNTWTSLISAAEKLGDIGRIRPVYDAFLAEYPLCYGYWKKYADAEAKYVSLQEASLVYDRGVAAVPYSVDLWGHYAMHKQKAAAPVEEVERLFERGLAYVGMDYSSHGLWDKYLAYELSLGAHATVAQLYLRLLRMPIQRLDEYRTRFHEYASQHSTAQLISEQERQGLAHTVAQNLRDEQEKLKQERDKLKEERAALAQKLQEEQAAQAAQAASAAQTTQKAAEQHAATAAQAAGNSDAAQAMDTTAEGDDVVDTVGQETVAAAGHMVSDITAPAAATTADSTAADDAPPAEAGPDAAPASPAPSVLAVPTPDDLAATVMADSAAAQSAAAVPTANAPSTAPPAVNSALPVSALPAGTVLAPPQDMPSDQIADTPMPQATIPQSDGAGDDDPMQDAAPLEAVPDQQAPAASAKPSPAASLASVTTGYTEAGQEAMPVPTAAAETAANASDADGQAAVAGAQQQPVAQATAVDGQQAEGADAAAAAAQEAIAEEQIKATWLASVDEVWTSTKEEWQRRKPFEDAIKRPYFHVKPLDTAQLQNWSRYLDYIEEKKDIGMIIRLYERCLVACASYPDLWMRYVRWQEGSSKAAAQVALERATSVHCKRRPEIQLFAAHFHERHGNIDMARALFKLVTDRLSPTLISGAVQHANFERRQGDKAAACSVYDKFLEREGVKGNATYAFVVIQYINALQWGFKDVVTAREVYNAALKKAADSLTLWEGVIHFEENLPGDDRITRVLDIYDRAVVPAQVDSAKPTGGAAAPDASATSDGTQDVPTAAAASNTPAEAAAAKQLTDSERELLSLRAVDFVDVHGDASLWSAVEKQHAQRFKLPGKVATSAATSRKRSSSEAADASGNKAAKTAAAATPAAAAAYAGAAALPGPPAASGAQASAAMSGYYSSAAPYYQYPQGYPAAQQPYAYPAASAAAAPAYQYQGYYG